MLTEILVVAVLVIVLVVRWWVESQEHKHAVDTLRRVHTAANDKLARMLVEAEEAASAESAKYERDLRMADAELYIRSEALRVAQEESDLRAAEVMRLSGRVRSLEQAYVDTDVQLITAKEECNALRREFDTATQTMVELRTGWKAEHDENAERIDALTNRLTKYQKELTLRMNTITAMRAAAHRFIRKTEARGYRDASGVRIEMTAAYSDLCKVADGNTDFVVTEAVPAVTAVQIS